ncbi:MAG: cyanophycinase [Candidatus Wallbacteria bacterium]|nr:cyanophycinase [Candidatus Wallbacteria bacterium]
MNLVLAGGGIDDSDKEYYGTIIKLAGGNHSRIGIITAASVPERDDPDRGTPAASNSRENGEFYLKLFTQHGAKAAEWIPIDIDTISNNKDEKLIARVGKMTGFFFGGGDQTRLVQCLMNDDASDTPLLSAIRRRFENGAVVSGTSAGTAIQSGIPMISGGVSYYGLRDGIYKDGAPHPHGDDDLTYSPQGGFAFFNQGLLDTHYVQRGRQGRSIRLAWERGVRLIFGVDAGATMVIRNANTPDAEMTVLSDLGVTVIDLSRARAGAGKEFSISNVLVHYLTHGDRMKIGKKEFQIADYKKPLAGREEILSVKPSPDIFSCPEHVVGTSETRICEKEFMRVTTGLFKSANHVVYGTTWEKNPRFQVKMEKSGKYGSAGYEGIRKKESVISYLNMLLEIKPLNDDFQNSRIRE